MGNLFEQPSQAQIRPKANYLCDHQIANDKTINLSTENVQKVHSRPKLWGFEKWCGKWPKCLNGCPVWTASTGLNKANIKISLCPSDSQWQDNHFEHRKCPKSPLQAKVMMVWKNQPKCLVGYTFFFSFTGQNLAEIQNFLRPSDSQRPDDSFEPWKSPKSSF